MTRDEPGGLIVRNQRYPRWPGVVTSVALVMWGTATCAFVALPGPSVPAATAGLIAFLSFAAAAAFGVFIRRPVESLRLGDELVPRPGFPSYRPEELRQVAFAPDAGEDYAEGRTAAPLCEASIHPRSPRGRLRLIVLVEDARRLRDWAAGKDIEVTDPTGALESADRS